MTLKIIDQSGDRFVVQDDKGTVHTYPNSPYWYVKLIEFNGERIIYNISPRNQIVETYENKLFHIKGTNIRGKRGQTVIYTRNNMADDIGNVILNHKIDNSYREGFKKLFDIFEDKINSNFDVEYLEMILDTYKDRIKVQTKGYVVDDRFIVTRENGEARLWEGDKSGKFLCVHPFRQGNMKDQIIELGGDLRKFSVHSQIILSKITYLLEPSANCPHSLPGNKYAGTTCVPNKICTVFTNQLPAKLKHQLQREFDERQSDKRFFFA